MTLPPNNIPQYRGLSETVNLVVKAIDLLNSIAKDDSIITDTNASIADRIAAYNDLVNIKSSSDVEVLTEVNPGVQSFFQNLNVKLDAYLNSVFLTVPSPSTQTGPNIFLQFNGKPATLYDLIEAIKNNDTSSDFGVSGFVIDGNDGTRSTCNWITSYPDLNTGDDIDGGGRASAGIQVDYAKDGGCNCNYDVSANGPAWAWANYTTGFANPDRSAYNNLIAFLEG